MKSKLVAYILWCGSFLAICGLHRIYAGKIVTGLLWLFTFGLLGIGQLIDLLLIPGMIDMANLKRGAANTNINTNTNHIVVNMAAPQYQPHPQQIAHHPQAQPPNQPNS
jgi:TM2 domain-containing membrane protein YozV